MNELSWKLLQIYVNFGSLLAREVPGLSVRGLIQPNIAGLRLLPGMTVK